MLPNSLPAAPDFDDWVIQARAKEIVGVLQPHFLDVVRKYRIAHQVMFGRWVYYRPDCERAREGVAAMRSERARGEAA